MRNCRDCQRGGFGSLSALLLIACLFSFAALAQDAPVVGDQTGHDVTSGGLEWDNAPGGSAEGENDSACTAAGIPDPVSAMDSHAGSGYSPGLIVTPPSSASRYSFDRPPVSQGGQGGGYRPPYHNYEQTYVPNWNWSDSVRQGRDRRGGHSLLLVEPFGTESGYRTHRSPPGTVRPRPPEFLPGGGRGRDAWRGGR